MSPDFHALSHELAHLGYPLVGLGVCFAALKETIPSGWEGRLMWGGIFFLACATVAHVVGAAFA